LDHPIGDSCAIIDGANAMSFTGIKENTLSGSRFTSINVSNNADIPVLLERVLTSHS
jgi:hypothetical protein